MTTDMPVPSRALHAQLKRVLIGVRRAQSAAIVSALALEQQHAERDADVASVMRHSVVDTIQSHLEQLESILKALVPAGGEHDAESDSPSTKDNSGHES